MDIHKTKEEVIILKSRSMGATIITGQTIVQNDGYYAGVNGQPLANNPHPEGTEERELWDKGWLEHLQLSSGMSCLTSMISNEPIIVTTPEDEA